MADIRAAILAGGGFLRRRDLLALGFADHAIEESLRSHVIFRVRQGWFSVPDMNELAVRAVRIGGRVTGPAALANLGIWAPEHDRIDIAVPAHARALRRPADMRARLTPADAAAVRIHWTDAPGRRGPEPWIVSPAEALGFILRHHGREDAVSSIDSALQLKRVSEREVGEVFRRAPARARAWESDVDARAQSGGETVVRLRCRDRGIPFEPQPYLPGVGYLDGQIGPRTFVEVDGRRWHDSPDAFAIDRRRDLVATAWGRRVIRLDYAMIYGSWGLCVDAMLECLAWDATAR